MGVRPVDHLRRRSQGTALLSPIGRLSPATPQAPCLLRGIHTEALRAGGLWALLLLLLTACHGEINDDIRPDPGPGRVAVVIGRPQTELSEDQARHFGAISSLRIVATDLQGRVVYSEPVRYGGTGRDLRPQQIACSDPIFLEEGTYEFFFIANERESHVVQEDLELLRTKWDVQRLTYFVPLTRHADSPLRIPLVGHLQRQLPRPGESDRVIRLTPVLRPAVALLEVHTAGATGVQSVELAFPGNRLYGGLFGYPYRREQDRSHEMRYYRLTPQEEDPTSYYVGLPEVYCYAPEQSRWRGAGRSSIPHLRVTLADGTVKILPLMTLPPETRPTDYADYLRIAGEEAPIGVGGLIDRFSLFAGRHLSYDLRTL